MELQVLQGSVLATLCLVWCAGSDLRPHHSPAFIILTKQNGEIWRCLLDTPTVCELFYKSTVFVKATVIYGEHLYVSEREGDIIKCDWYGRHQCALFYRFTKPVYSFAVLRGRLYVQVGDSEIYRCELSLQPHSCSKEGELGSIIYSELYINDIYIYTSEGYHGDILRFTEDFEVKTQHVSTANEQIKSVTGYGKTIITYSDANTVQYYNPKLKVTSSPVVFPIKYHFLNCIAVFKGILYLTNNHVDNMLMCKWDEPNNCTEFVQHDNAVRSISFVYATHHMRSEFVDVSSCGWQSSPWTVFNYREEQRPMLEASVADGKLVDARGKLVDTRMADVGYSGPAAVFAMLLGGQILFSYAHRSSLVHITSLFDGLPVAGAGEMIVQDGVVKKIVACSVFYEPNIELNKQVVDALYMKGYEGEIELEECVYTCDRE